MKKLFVVFALLLVGSMTFAQGKSQVERLSRKRAEWLLTKNVDSLASLYEPTGFTIHSNGLVKSSAEHLNDVKSGVPSYIQIDIKNLDIKEFGNTAVAVGKGYFMIEMGGKEMAYNMVFSEVYIKKGKQWKLVSRHANAIE